MTRPAELELVGEPMRVVRSPCAHTVGIGGTVVDETMSMLVLRDGDRTRWLPKAGSVFSLAGAEVDGGSLVGRPHDRRGAR
ncbi:MAG: ribonuclease P protein subunit [Thaumarchaeota archaeon]|nr:ribonuclease P protein subunit [Nitrososphaerota archaeon]